MVYYDEDIRKDIQKGKLPEEIARLFIHAFESIDSINDLSLFDIKKLVLDSSVNYYRIRKGKYRAVFKIGKQDVCVGNRKETGGIKKMTVVSVRLNEEEKILPFLTDYLEKDKSTVLKSSLNDMYKDIIDREEIKKYETLEKNGKTKFHSFENIIREARPK